MRIFVNGELYDSKETPIYVALEEDDPAFEFGHHDICTSYCSIPANFKTKETLNFMKKALEKTGRHIAECPGCKKELVEVYMDNKTPCFNCGYIGI